VKNNNINLGAAPRWDGRKAPPTSHKGLFCIVGV